jgi:hypothetical protein
MSYTVEQFTAEANKQQSSEKLTEPGEYTMRVAKAFRKVGDREWNKDQDILTLVLNPLADPDDSASYKHEVYFQDITFPKAGGDQDEFNKRMKSVAFWAEILGVSPGKDKETQYNAYIVDTVNKLYECDAGSLTGVCFKATFAPNAKGYLTMKTKSKIS